MSEISISDILTNVAFGLFGAGMASESIRQMEHMPSVHATEIFMLLAAVLWVAGNYIEYYKQKVISNSNN